MPRFWFPILVLLGTLASSSQVTPSTAEIKSLDLNLILQRLEDIQHQNPAQSRPYEVTREYKLFRGNDKKPTSEVMAQINFVPPDMKTYLKAALLVDVCYVTITYQDIPVEPWPRHIRRELRTCSRPASPVTHGTRLPHRTWATGWPGIESNS